MSPERPSSPSDPVDLPPIPPPPAPPPGPTRLGRRIAAYFFGGIIFLAGLAASFRYFIAPAVGIHVVYMPSESMEPTIMGHKEGMSSTGVMYPSEVHDRVLINTRAYRSEPPHSGDIIAFLAPKEADMGALEEHRPPVENELLKRIVAVGGQTVEIRAAGQGTAKLYLNGKPVDESGIHFLEPMQDIDMYGSTFAVPGAPFAVNKPFLLKPDEVFVLGDNRNHSNDSRFWGPLKVSRIIGKATAIVAPMDRARDLP